MKHTFIKEKREGRKEKQIKKERNNEAKLMKVFYLTI